MGLEAMDLERIAFSRCLILRKSKNKLYLDSLGIKLQTLLLVGEELLNIFALIALKLNHLSHLSVDDDGAIAS
jgi:hypothetical protein